MSKRPPSRRRSDRTGKRLYPSNITFAQALDRCPFRTLIGTGTDAEDIMSRVGCAIAVGAVAKVVGSSGDVVSGSLQRARPAFERRWRPRHGTG
jgi:hypothetical protein